MFLAINVIEYLCNKIKELPGYQPGDYLGTWEWVEKSDEGWDSYQTKELNNGASTPLIRLHIFFLCYQACGFPDWL